MITRVQSIRGIGLFHETQPLHFSLERVNLILAPNGTGKSTFTLILQSLGAGGPKWSDPLISVQ